MTPPAVHRCQCDGNRWLRDADDSEPLPTHCPTCGGTDPPGLILQFEIVDTVKEQ
jgi:hypothetical protein